MTEEQLCSYAVGDWVLVSYDGKSQSYPSEITEVHESSLRIKAMGKGWWKFQMAKKGRQYKLRHIKYKSLNHPIVVGNRGQFKFTDA